MSRRKLGAALVVASLFALLPGTVASARPDPGAPPVTISETVVGACNNSFSPAKFVLTYDIDSTVTAPVTGGGDALEIFPGDSFTVEFDITVNLARDFKIAAYSIIGPIQVPMTEARVTLAPLSGVESGPILSVGTGVTGGFTTVNLPAPGRTATGVSLVENSTTATGAPGTFLAADVGKFFVDTNPATGTTQPGTTVVSVNGDGSEATLSLGAALTGGPLPIQIWEPDEVTDSAIHVGTTSGTYVADSTATGPYNATFQILGNSTYTGNGTTIPADPFVGFSSNSGTSDPRLGTAVVENTAAGFNTAGAATNAAKNTYLRAQLGPVLPYLPCMGGTWSVQEDPDDPLLTVFDLPYNPPAGQTDLTIGAAADGSNQLGIPVNTTNGSPVLTAVTGPGTFDPSDVGLPVQGSFGLDDARPSLSGIPDNSRIIAVSANGSTATMSNNATLTHAFNPGDPTAGPLVDLVGGFGATEVIPIPVPTADITDVSGQVVNNAARAGNVITFGGPNWTPSATVDSVELCDSTGAVCDAAGLSGVSTSIDSNGVLSGTATVTSTATEGAGRRLKVVEGANEDFRATLLVLGAPTLTAPSSGPAGGAVNVTGSNWNPNPLSVPNLETVTLLVPIDNLVDQNPLAAPVPAVVNATGGLTGTVVTPAGTGAIIALDGLYPAPPASGSLFAFSGFLVNANQQDCGSDAPLAACTLAQNLVLNIEAGTFSWSQQTPFIVLNSTTTGDDCDLTDDYTGSCYGLQLDGTTQTAVGALNQITVVDARGQGAAWTINATMSDLTTGAGAANQVLPANTVTFTPDCAVVDGHLAGGTAEVIEGAPGTLHNTTALTVCSAAAGHAGGTFTADGGISLSVPASIFAGLYQATLTLVAV